MCRGADRKVGPSAYLRAFVGRLVWEDDRSVTSRVSVADNAYCARGKKLPIIVEALLVPSLSNTVVNEVRLR